MNSRKAKRPSCRPNNATSPMAVADYDVVSRALCAISKNLGNCEMPSGYYYVILDDVNSALALISYLALRSGTTMCGLPADWNFDKVQKLLAKITNLTVHNYGPDDDADIIYGGYRAIPPSSDIYLRWGETCCKYWKASADDCLVCWGLPTNVRKWVYECFGRATRICMILTATQYRQMVEEQPISTCYLKPHPLSEPLNISLQNATHRHLVTIDNQDEGRSLAPNSSTNYPQSTEQRTSISFHLQSCPLPEGHYHIVLNESLDTIPLISYLALQSTRTLCYLGDRSSSDQHQELLHQVTGIETMRCTEVSTAGIKVAMQKFKSTPKAIMLRPEGNGWNTGFRKLLADCVIYCGVPGNTDEFRENCSLKTKCSYLIISPSQPTSRKKSSGGSQHPSSYLLNNDKEGSVLHELRLKTGTILENLDNPPISVNQYKAALNRRRLIPAPYSYGPPSFNELSSSLRDPVLHVPRATKNQLNPIKNLRIYPSAPRMTALPHSRLLAAGGFSRAPDADGISDATHYYIILNDMSDAIPLIAYITQHSKKTVCGLPADRSLEKTQKLLEHITGLDVTFCDSNDKQCLRNTAQMFRKQSTGVLLRPNLLCYASLRWSGADCLVYWGPLPSIRGHISRCLESVTHTYVILTKAQYDQMLDKQPKFIRHLKEHPASKQLNNVFQDSPLHSFRAKLKSHSNHASTVDPFLATHEHLVSIKSHNLFSDPQLLPWSSANSWESKPLDHTAWKSKMDSWDDMSFDEFSDLRGILRTYPKLPSGRNYIVLDRGSDVVPFTACMALQSDKTVCIIEEHMTLGLYAKIFEQVTESDVLYPKDTDEVDSIKGLLEALRLKDSPAMLLLSQEAAAKAPLNLAKPDCVLYWGLPFHFPHYFQEISSLHSTARSCLVLTSAQEAEGLGLKGKRRLNKGVARYPNASVKSYLGPDSPFRDVRLRAFQALSNLMISNPSALNDRKHSSSDITSSESGSDELEVDMDWRDQMEGYSDNEHPQSVMIASGWGRMRAQEVEQNLIEANEDKQVYAQQSKDFRQWVKVHKAKARILRKVNFNSSKPSWQPENRLRLLM